MAFEAVRDLLTDIPNVEIDSVDDYEESVGRDYGIDLRIGLSHGVVDYTLIIEVKANGAPRFVRSAVYQLESYVVHLLQSRHADDNRRLIPMLVSPYLSPESRAICTAHNIAYLDLFGNAYILLSIASILIGPSQTSLSPKSVCCGQFSPRKRALSCA